MSAESVLKLNEISLARVSAGAYHISYSGKAPPGALVLLGVPDAKNAMDVTHRCTGPALWRGCSCPDLSVCCCRSRPGLRLWPDQKPVRPVLCGA